ncbi:unnamed protein product [Thelazia callipaeda]|uniref:Ig-like domain-containing protein n=1 Tax=Thelazia callipaeda TaxID=103827 RepID=A0A0N5CWF7_THECL|nr:unnamed protein product [Thelazia callipaeda]
MYRMAKILCTNEYEIGKKYMLVTVRTTNERFLGFHFTEEPSNAVAKSGRIELNCRFITALKDVSSHIEWRKDGAELSILRSNGKMLV